MCFGLVFRKWLSPIWHQAATWANIDYLLIWPQERSFTKIQQKHNNFQKMFLKIPFVKCGIWFSGLNHYSDVIVSTMSFEITASRLFTRPFGADQRKHQSSASLAVVSGIHRWPANPPAQRASNVENVSIWWRHHMLGRCLTDFFRVTEDIELQIWKPLLMFCSVLPDEHHITFRAMVISERFM